MVILLKMTNFAMSRQETIKYEINNNNKMTKNYTEPKMEIMIIEVESPLAQSPSVIVKPGGGGSADVKAEDVEGMW